MRSARNVWKWFIMQRVKSESFHGTKALRLILMRFTHSWLGWRITGNPVVWHKTSLEATQRYSMAESDFWFMVGQVCNYFFHFKHCMRMNLKSTKWGTEQIFIWGGSTPRSKPLPFHVPFFTKRYPFHIPSIDKWYPFHIPSLQLCIPVNCCKCTVFSTGISDKNGMFSWLISHKIHLLALLGPFQRPKWQISLLFINILQQLKSLPFHRLEAWKRYPFWASLPI